MIDLAVLLILGFASYRATRFVVLDTLPEKLRQRFFLWLVNRKRLPRLSEKVLELFSCTFCAGAWITLIIASLYFKELPWAFTTNEWLSAIGIAGVQAFIHTVEPEGDDHEH